MTTYTWTDNMMRSGSACDVDKVADNLMHLKYNNVPNLLTPNAINSGTTDSSGNPNVLSYSDNVVTLASGTTLTDCARNTYTLASASTTTITPTKFDYMVPVMTANNIPAGYLASASSNYTGYEPYKAFDRSPIAGWATNDTPTGFISIQLPSAKIAKYYRYQPSGITTYTAKNWTIEGSNDGTNWTILHTVINKDTSSNIVTYKLDTFGSYLYYKMNISANNGAVGVQVWALDFFEENTNGTIYFDETKNIFVGIDGIMESFATPYSIGKTLPTNPIVDQIHYDTSIEPVSVKKWNGTDWQIYNKVLCGQSITNSSGAISSIIQPQFNQDGYYKIKKYDSGWFAVSASTKYVKTHGLGTSNIKYDVLIADDVNGTNQRKILGLNGNIGYISNETTSNTMAISTSTYVGLSISGTNLTTAYYRILAEVI